MKVFKTWVFPILRILIFAAVAVALVKIAFFPDTQSTQPTNPGGELVNPTVTVERGSIMNEIIVGGTVTRNATIEIKAPLSGTAGSVGTKEGRTVKSGQKLTTIKQDYPSKTVSVKAPTSGTIGKVNVVKGQQANTGEALFELLPNAFHVSGSIEPAQLYRLLDAPKEAIVSINGGPAPFTCTGLKVEATDNGTTVKCNIPKDVTVFAGLPAQISIPAGVADDVLVIPTTAVEGGAENGNVWVVTADGTEEIRQVTLGLNDGMMVEVIEGLKEGETILQFVPGADEVIEDPGFEPMPMGRDSSTSCYTESDGSMTCVSN